MFICFVDLKQAFDRVRLQDIVKISQNSGINNRYIRIIQELNKDTRIKTEIGLTEKVPIIAGIRQDDSLSPTLFNIVMNQIIQDVSASDEGYGMRGRQLKVLCYADNAILTAENKNDLLLYRFKTSAGNLNMVISMKKRNR